MWRSALALLVLVALAHAQLVLVGPGPEGGDVIIGGTTTLWFQLASPAPQQGTNLQFELNFQDSACAYNTPADNGWTFELLQYACTSTSGGRCTNQRSWNDTLSNPTTLPGDSVFRFDWGEQFMAVEVSHVLGVGKEWTATLTLDWTVLTNNVSTTDDSADLRPFSPLPRRITAGDITVWSSSLWGQNQPEEQWMLYKAYGLPDVTRAHSPCNPVGFSWGALFNPWIVRYSLTFTSGFTARGPWQFAPIGNGNWQSAAGQSRAYDRDDLVDITTTNQPVGACSNPPAQNLCFMANQPAATYGAEYTFTQLNQTYVASSTALNLPALPDWVYYYQWQWTNVNQPLLNTEPRDTAQSLTLQQPYITISSISINSNGFMTGLNTNVSVTRNPGFNDAGVTGTCTVTQGPSSGLSGYGGGVLQLRDGTGPTGGWDIDQSTTTLFMGFDEVGYYTVSCVANGYLPGYVNFHVWDRNLPPIWALNNRDPVSLEWLDDDRPLLSDADILNAILNRPPSHSTDYTDYFSPPQVSNPNIVYSFARTDSSSAGDLFTDFSGIDGTVRSLSEWQAFTQQAAGNITFAADRNGNQPGTYTIGYTVTGLQDATGVSDYIHVRINRVGFSLWCENAATQSSDITLSWLVGPTRCTIGLQSPLPWAQTFVFVRDPADTRPTVFNVVAADLPLTIPAGEQVVNFRIEPAAYYTTPMEFWLEPQNSPQVPGGNVSAWLGVKPGCGGADIIGTPQLNTNTGNSLTLVCSGGATVEYAQNTVQFSTSYSSYTITVDAVSGGGFDPNVAIYTLPFDDTTDCPIAGGPGVSRITGFTPDPNQNYVIAVFDSTTTGTYSIDIEADDCRGTDGEEYYSDYSWSFYTANTISIAAEMQQGLMDWRHGETVSYANITIDRLPKWGDMDVLLLEAVDGTGPSIAFNPSVVTFKNESILCPNCTYCPEACYVTVEVLPRLYYWGSTLSATFIPDTAEALPTTEFSLTAVGNGGAATTQAELFITYSPPTASNEPSVNTQFATEVSAISSPFYDTDLYLVSTGGTGSSSRAYSVLSSPIIHFAQGDTTLGEDIVFSPFAASTTYYTQPFSLKSSRLSGSFYQTPVSVSTPSLVVRPYVELSPRFDSYNSNDGPYAGILPGSTVEMTAHRFAYGDTVDISYPVTLIVYATSFPAGLIEVPENVTIPAGALTTTFNMNVTRAKKESRVTPNGLGQLCVRFQMPTGVIYPDASDCTEVFSMGESVQLESSSACIGDSLTFTGRVTPELQDKKSSIDLFVGFGEKHMGFTGMDYLFKYADYPTQKQRFIAGQTETSLSLQLSSPISTALLVRTKSDESDHESRSTLDQYFPFIYVSPKGCSFDPSPADVYINATTNRVTRIVFTSYVVQSSSTPSQGYCSLPSKHTGTVEFFVQMLWGESVMQPVRSSFTLDSTAKVTQSIELEFDVLDQGSASFLVYTHNEEYGRFYPITYTTYIDTGVLAPRAIESSDAYRESTGSVNVNNDVVGTHRWVQIPIYSPPNLFGTSVTFVMTLVSGEDVYDWSVSSNPDYTFSDEDTVFTFTGDAVTPGYGEYRLTIVPPQIDFAPVDFVVNVVISQNDALDAAIQAGYLNTFHSLDLQNDCGSGPGIGDLCTFTVEITPPLTADGVLTFDDVAGVWSGLPTSYAVPAMAGYVSIDAVLASWAASASVTASISGYQSSTMQFVPSWNSDYSVEVYPTPEFIVLNDGDSQTFTVRLDRPAHAAGLIIPAVGSGLSGLSFSPSSLAFAAGDQEMDFTVTVTTRADAAASYSFTLLGSGAFESVVGSNFGSYSLTVPTVVVTCSARLYTSSSYPDASSDVSVDYEYGHPWGSLGSEVYAVDVSLVDVSSSPEVVLFTRTAAQGTSYTFDNIYPGNYEWRCSSADSRVVVAVPTAALAVEVGLDVVTSGRAYLELDFAGSGYYMNREYRLTQPLATDVTISHALSNNNLLNNAEFTPSPVIVIPAGQWSAAVRVWISPTVECQLAYYTVTATSAGPLEPYSDEFDVDASARSVYGLFSMSSGRVDRNSELNVAAYYGKYWLGRSKFFSRQLGSSATLERSGHTNHNDNVGAKYVSGLLQKSTGDFGRAGVVVFPYNLLSRKDKSGVIQERGVTSHQQLSTVGQIDNSMVYYFQTVYTRSSSGYLQTATNDLGPAYWAPGEMRLVTVTYNGGLYSSARRPSWSPTGRELILQFITNQGDANLTFDVLGPSPQAGSFSVALNDDQYSYTMWVQASTTPATKISTWMLRPTWTVEAKNKPSGLTSYVGEFSVGPVLEVFNARTDFTTVNQHYPLTLRFIGHGLYQVFINKDSVDRRLFYVGYVDSYYADYYTTYMTGDTTFSASDISVLPYDTYAQATDNALGQSAAVAVYSADPEGPYWLAGDKDRSIALGSASGLAVSVLAVLLLALLAL